MKKLMLLSFLLITCTKNSTDPICKSVFRATAGTASVIATVLECKNVGAIAADLSDQILKLGLCAEQQTQSTLSDFICPQVGTLVTNLVSSTIPKNWECSNTIINGIIKEKIASSCISFVK